MQDDDNIIFQKRAYIGRSDLVTTCVENETSARSVTPVSIPFDASSEVFIPRESYSLEMSRVQGESHGKGER